MLLRIPIEFIIPVETAVGLKKYQDFLGLLARSKNRTKKLFEVSVRADIAKQKELVDDLVGLQDNLKIFDKQSKPLNKVTVFFSIIIFVRFSDVANQLRKDKRSINQQLTLFLSNPTSTEARQ